VEQGLALSQDILWCLKRHLLLHNSTPLNK
jgi:hypothetical protein